MKTLFTNTNTWRTTVLTVCSAFLLLCCTTVNAQTTFGPFASAPALDLTAVDDLYDGTFATMGSDAIAVSGVAGDVVLGISVDVAITHTWEGDLTLKLTSPDGDTITLLSRPGLADVGDDGADCCGNNSTMDGSVITFSDAGVTDAELLGNFGELNAGETVCSGDALCSYFPNAGSAATLTNSFADLLGGTMNGAWTLYVGDAGLGDNGSLDSWSITIVTASPSFTLVKTVNLEPDPSGLNCLDLPIGTEQVIGVNPGDSVCYWYTATNTGDVDFDLIDFIDDQLIPTGLFGAPGFDLAVGASLAIPWSDVPVEINAEVTNIADITYYNSTSGFSSGTETSTATVGMIPANDECSAAIPLSCGVPTTGTTYFSTDTGNPTTCGLLAGDLGVWYSFVGDGGVAQITTCGAVSEADGLQPWIAIYDGACGSENCVANGSAADASCGNANAWSLEAQTVAGTTYFVFVMGISGNPEVLDFDITLNCLPPANDLCTDAVTLICGDVAAGNTNTATDTDASLCDADGLGVWFYFLGNGDNVTLDLSNSDYDTYLGVSETCGGPCIASDDDGGTGTTSMLSFPSVIGQDYFIQVSGFGSATGNYELAVTCVTPPANDQCAGAIDIACGQTESANTVGASADASLGTCTTSLTSAPGLWYHFAGTGEDVTATTCNVGTDFDTKMGVFSGDCFTLVCVDGNDDQLGDFDPACESTNIGSNRASTVTFSSVSGTDYYIYVTGFGSAAGNFDLSLSCVCPVTATVSGGGVACDGATVDVSVALTGTGPWDLEIADGNGNTTSVSQTSDNPYVLSTAVAGTYTVTTVTDALCSGPGDGSSAVVDAADSPVASFTSAQVAGTLSVDFTNTSTGPANTFGWDFGDLSGSSSDENPSYTYAAPGVYEVIFDASNACGPSSVTVEITVNPLNNLCDGAEMLTVGATCTPVTGTVAGATESMPGCAGTADDDVWYSFVATSDQAMVDVQGSVGFDAVLELLDGADCNNLTSFGCIDATLDAGLESAQLTGLTPGTTYYIRVYDWYAGAPAGLEFDICVYDVPPPPANDVACSAVALTNDGVANGPYDHSGYTAAVWEVAAIPAVACAEQGGWCVNTDVENSAWYTFVAPASGNVTVSSAGSLFDTQVAVYSGVSCQDIESGTGVLEGANDDDPAGGLQSFVILCDLNPGDTYFVLLDGYGGAEGDATLTVTETTVDAGFTYVATGLSVDFTDASSTSSAIVSYSWDFGDASPLSADMNPTHVYAADGPYTVCLTVTDENGCTSEYCEGIQVTDPITSIAEAVENGMEVYPNPSNGQFIVTVRGVEADVQIIVMDVAGRQVYNEGATLNNSFRKELNLNVAKGTYLLQIGTVEGLVTRKIQIQ